VTRDVVLAVLACTGCATDSEPYPVAAVANLEPIAARITGPIEVIGVLHAPSDSSARTLAAYRVRLPDLVPRRVRIFQMNVCDMDTAPVGPDGTRQLIEVADLQEIRRVGVETHFFAPAINLQGRRVDVDVGTAQAQISTSGPDAFGYVFGLIAVVQELDHEDGTPGAWLACGRFIEAPGAG
jgi:hypothetical protein